MCTTVISKLIYAFIIFSLIMINILIYLFIILSDSPPEPSTSPYDTNQFCAPCHKIIPKIRSLFQNNITMTIFYTFMEHAASFFIDRSVARACIANYGDILMNSIFTRIFNPDILCPKFRLCNNNYPSIPITSYAERILSQQPQPRSTSLTSPSSSSTSIRMLQLTDIHLDLHYTENSVANCNLPFCCQTNSNPPLNYTSLTFAGKYGTVGKCDANMNTLTSFAKYASTLSPDFIIYTGDNVAHTVWDVTFDDIISSTQQTVNIIKQHFPSHTVIYPCIGNHESSPVDQFNNVNQVQLLHALADVFKEYLTEQAYEMFKQHGYYSQRHVNTTLRIISLNGLLCDSFNFYLIANTTLTKRMYDWFEMELRNAELNNETVYIIDHIPIGHDQHLMQCSYRMKILLQRYKAIIKAYISAHTHRDEIKLVREYNNVKKYNMVNWVSSGLTTFNRYLPSFRIFDIDQHSFRIKEIEQYRMNLTHANTVMNSNTDNDNDFWYLSYNMTSLLNTTDLYDVNAISQINIAGDYLQKVWTDTPYAIANKYNTQAIVKAYCDFKYDDLEESNACKGVAGVQISEAYLHYIFSKLSGEWREDS